MKIGLIGAGRMGRILAKILAAHNEIYVFDQNKTRLMTVAEESGAIAVDDLEMIAQLGTVILALPDGEVLNCIKVFNQQPESLIVINIATNVAQHVLEDIAAPHIQCIGAKFVGHADEIAFGHNPVIIVNDQPVQLVPLAAEIFRPVGKVIIGKADMVTVINTITAEKVLEAAVCIEEALHKNNITDPAIVKSALRQVGAGIIKSYADGSMGPFARQVVQAVKAKLAGIRKE